MSFSDNAMSAILLCSYLGIDGSDGLKPLSLGEWNGFLDKLSEAGLEPGAVLGMDTADLGRLQQPEESAERIRKLAARGGSVAFVLSELAGKGVGAVTSFDADYPKLVRQRLQKKMPPVLFYAGNIQLANKIGIGVVGSRNVDEDGMEFTRRLAEKAASEKLMLYSGGARGVDTISESAALNAGGGVVSYLADSLLSRIKKKEVLNGILQERLLLFSDVKPDAGFSAARAMNRNKYIYASSYAAFVVSADYNKGGTWNGAMEAMRNRWTKTMVWNHKEYDGNQKLIEAGGKAYELSDEKLYDVITRKDGQEYVQMDLFHME